MAKSYRLINSQRKEVKRSIKNENIIEEVFEYMFIETGKLSCISGKESPLITTTVSIK